MFKPNQNEGTQQSGKMSVILASDAVKGLGKTLELTHDQLAKAKSAALSLSGDPKLSQCAPYSIVKAIYETACYDFSRSDSIYFIPYGNNVQAQIGYRGFQELAMRSGKYSKIDAYPVRECDRILRNDDGEPEIALERDWVKASQSKVVGYFGYARDAKTNKIVKSVYMTLDELQRHGKTYSKTFRNGGGVWATDFDKMAKKTVIKQVCKDLDQTPLLQRAEAQDQMVFGEKDGYYDSPKASMTIDATPKNSLEGFVLPAPEAEEQNTAEEGGNVSQEASEEAPKGTESAPKAKAKGSEEEPF